MGSPDAYGHFINTAVFFCDNKNELNYLPHIYYEALELTHDNPNRAAQWKQYATFIDAQNGGKFVYYAYFLTKSDVWQIANDQHGLPYDVRQGQRDICLKIFDAPLYGVPYRLESNELVINGRYVSDKFRVESGQK